MSREEMLQNLRRSLTLRSTLPIFVRDRAWLDVQLQWTRRAGTGAAAWLLEVARGLCGLQIAGLGLSRWDQDGVSTALRDWDSTRYSLTAPGNGIRWLCFELMAEHALAPGEVEESE